MVVVTREMGFARISRQPRCFFMDGGRIVEIPTFL